jgi:rSAM/selenodomain-associated transferase 1
MRVVACQDNPTSEFSDEAQMDDALIVVAKQPEPGFTKTRLCPPLTPEVAAELYLFLMLDTLTLAARMDRVDHTIAFAPPKALAYFQSLAPVGFRLLPQVGSDLGQRLANALAHHFDRGYRKVVIMNSDGPTLPLAFLEEAFSGLDEADITLGRGHDGGYYLIGMTRLEQALFQNIAWSTAKVIPQTIASCRRLGLKVHELPEWYDVDVGADLARLRKDLTQNPASAPSTYAFLRRLDRS